MLGPASRHRASGREIMPGLDLLSLRRIAGM